MEETSVIPKNLEEQFQDPNWGAEQLKGITLFKKFSQEELVGLYGKGEVRLLKPQSYAVIEGEPSRGLYIILHGTVSVYKNDLSTGSMFRIAYLEKGASFGEMSLFDSAPRSASVAGETLCYLFYLDAAVFERYLAATGADLEVRFYKTCAEEMSARFRVINSDYINSQQLLWKYALRRAEGQEDTGAA